VIHLGPQPGPHGQLRFPSAEPNGRAAGHEHVLDHLSVEQTGSDDLPKLNAARLSESTAT
jgi:hypothetical protein